MSMPTEQTPAEKLLHERQLFAAMESKVIDRAIRVHCDNPPAGALPGTWPAEVIVKATKRLCREVNSLQLPGQSGEISAYKIDRTLEDIVIGDSAGAFYWDEEGKRHLRLNPPGWPDCRRV